MNGGGSTRRVLLGLIVLVLIGVALWLFAPSLLPPGLTLPGTPPISPGNPGVGVAQEFGARQVQLIDPLSGQGITISLLRLLYVVGGLVLLALGWRFYQLALAVAGFLIGAGVGAALAPVGSPDALVLVLMVVLGLVGTGLATLAYYVGVLLIGGYIGLLATVQLLTTLRPDAPVSVLAQLVGALVGAGIFLALAFELTVLLTAFAGAVLLLVGVLGTTAVNPLWVLVLFLLGVGIQVGLARSQGENAFRRREAV